MSFVMLTFDLDSHHREVKAAALSAGFTDTIFTNDGSLRTLPNTCLMVEARTAEEAMDRFVAVVRAVNPFVRITAATTVEWSEGVVRHEAIRNFGIPTPTTVGHA